MTVSTEIKKPDSCDKAAFPARASPQHILGIHASTTVNGGDRLNRFDTGEFLCHPIRLVVLDHIGKAVQSFRCGLDEQFPETPTAHNRAGLSREQMLWPMTFGYRF